MAFLAVNLCLFAPPSFAQTASDAPKSNNPAVRSGLDYRLARDNRLVTAVSLDDLKAIITAMQHTSLDSGMDNNQPFIRARNQNGEAYLLMGRACTEENLCSGLNIRSDFPLSGPADYARLNAVNVRHAAIATYIANDEMSVSRYLILDHGMTMRNIKLNIDVLLSSAASAAEQYFGKPVAMRKLGDSAAIETVEPTSGRLPATPAPNKE